MNKECFAVLENEQVAAAFNSGDSQLQSRLYRCLKQVFDEVYIRILMSKLDARKWPNARLMAQDAFNNAFVNLRDAVQQGSFAVNKSASVRTFFYTILYRRFVDEIRMCGEVGLFAALEERCFGVASRPSQDHPVLNKPDAYSNALHEAIATLSDSCKKYMQWQYVEQKEVAEISRLSGKAAGTVIKDLSRCRGSLMKQMRQRFFPDA